jgi:hypothetical protein
MPFLGKFTSKFVTERLSPASLELHQPKPFSFQISPCEPQKIPKTLLEVTDLSGVPDVC